MCTRTRTHYWGLYTHIVGARGDIESWDNKPETIKGLSKQFFSGKYLEFSGKMSGIKDGETVVSISAH